MGMPTTCLTCQRGPNQPLNPWCRKCIINTKMSSAEENYLPLDGESPFDREIYIAGPFFNPAQVAIIEEIETTLNGLHVSYFSPRLEGGVVAERPDLDPMTIFRNNFLAILRCKWMINVAVYAGVRLLSIPADATDVVQGVPVAIPDTGTVWEAGAAYALNKPIVGYLPLAAAREMYKINLMLTESWEHLCQGPEELRQFVFGNPRRQRWHGGVI